MTTRLAGSALILIVAIAFGVTMFATGNGSGFVAGMVGSIVWNALRSIRAQRAVKAHQARVIAENAAKGIETHFVSMKDVRRQARREARAAR